MCGSLNLLAAAAAGDDGAISYCYSCLLMAMLLEIFQAGRFARQHLHKKGIDRAEVRQVVGGNTRESRKGLAPCQEHRN
jgi:hypothetical protein